MNMEHAKYNLVLFGKTGSGVSASGNTILPKNTFPSEPSTQPTTQCIANGNITFYGDHFTVYDTPGLSSTERSNEEILSQWRKLLQLEESAPTVYLLVIRPDRFTEEEKNTVQEMERFLGEGRMKNTWILFTRGDALERHRITIEDFIKGNENLERVVDRFEGRYHVFNNQELNPHQVRELIKKLTKAQKELATGPPPPPHPGPPPPLPLQISRLPKRRLVLLGKTGAGKSASGNTILGQERFESELSSNSVTAQAEVQRAIVAERLVSVVDTPGLFDTDLSQEDVVYELGRSIYECSPGPHALVIVLPLISRFSPQEKQVIDVINAFYGEDALQYTIILFTCGDQLEGRSVERHIKRSKALSNLVNRCGGRYHVFNNKDKTNRRQVTELLEKIDAMVEKNGGGYYSNKMLEDAMMCRVKQAEQAYWEEKERERLEEQKRKGEIAMAVKEAQEEIMATIDEERSRRKEMEEQLEVLRKELSDLRSQAGKPSAEQENRSDHGEDEGGQSSSDIQTSTKDGPSQEGATGIDDQSQARAAKHRKKGDNTSDHSQMADGQSSTEVKHDVKATKGKEEGGFKAFIKKHWKALLIAAVVGGIICTGIGAGIGAGIVFGMGTAVGTTVGIGAGIGAGVGVLGGTGIGMKALEKKREAMDKKNI